MKVLVTGVVLLALLGVYRALSPKPTVEEPVSYAVLYPDSFVSGACEIRVRAKVKGSAEIMGAHFMTARDRSFKWYAAQVRVTDAAGSSRVEDWGCRYYPNGQADVKRLGIR